MKRFLTASDQDYADLEHQARASAYLNFPDCELPPGCVPARRRTGLKVDRGTGATTLFIERATHYYGANRTIAAWVQQGQLFFPSFADLRHFISTELASSFGVPWVAEVPAPLSAATPDQPRPAAPQADQNDGDTQTCALTIRSSLDPVTCKLIGFLVRHTASNYSVGIESIDGAVFTLVHSKLLAAIDQATCDTIVDELFRGVFSVASVEGHERVDLQAGPPIRCNPAKD